MTARLPIALRTFALLLALGSAVVVQGAACSLNPQPLPPIENGASPDAGRGGAGGNTATVAGEDAASPRSDGGSVYDATGTTPPVPGLDSGSLDTSGESVDGAVVDTGVEDGGEAGALDGASRDGAVDGDGESGLTDGALGGQG